MHFSLCFFKIFWLRTTPDGPGTHGPFGARARPIWTALVFALENLDAVSKDIATKPCTKYCHTRPNKCRRHSKLVELSRTHHKATTQRTCNIKTHNSFAVHPPANTDIRACPSHGIRCHTARPVGHAGAVNEFRDLTAALGDVPRTRIRSSLRTL